MKNLPPIIQNILQILLMIVLAFIFGALILLGASYFDDRPREALIFFLIAGCLGVLNWFWKRRKRQQLSADEAAAAQQPKEVKQL